MSLSEARQYLANTVADWQGVRLADLQFWHRGDGRLFVLGLAFLAAVRPGLRARSSCGSPAGIGWSCRPS